MIKFENILYTPLDTKPIPSFDIDKLYQWLDHSHKDQERWRKRISKLTSESSGVVSNYPWNISIAYFNMTGKGPGWLNNFDLDFPNLTEYFLTCFNIPIDSVGSIIMLPMKTDALGPGFYHQDHDWYGLRLYLEFEDSKNNSLMIRPTKEPYLKQEMIQTPIDESLLQKKEIRAKILSNRYAWYINNVRACHSTHVDVPGSRRLAVIYTSRFTNHDDVFPIVKDLVLRSVDKFPEYVVEWQPE
jgi:hypothetical protein